MPEDIVEREDAIDEAADAVESQDVASASDDDNEVEATADAGQTEQQADQAGNEEESEKPAEESKVDWEDVAKRERYKRKREREAREQAEARLAELDARSEQHQARESSITQPVIEAPKLPSLSDPEINYDEGKFQAAMLDYSNAQIDRKLEERDRARQAEKAQNDARSRAQQYTDKLSAYAARTPEFVKAFEEAGRPKFGHAKDSLLMDSPHGPEVEHLLYSDLGKLDAFLEADPLKAMRMVVEAEKAIEDRKSLKGRNSRRKASDAPPPVKTAEGSAVAEENKFPNARILTATY